MTALVPLSGKPQGAIAQTLKDLKLAGMAKTLDVRQTEATERKLSYGCFLELLLEDEKSNREVNSFKKRKTKARLPYNKTIEDYDFSFQAELKKQLIFELATTKFMDKAENIIFMGQPGTGKTHLAAAIGH